MRPGLRFKVLTRDNYTCRYCGASAPDATLHVDHVIPKSRGGRDSLDNLVTACAPCNLGKQAALTEQAAMLGELVLDFGFPATRRAMSTLAERDGFQKGMLCEHESEVHDDSCSDFVTLDLFEIRQMLQRWRRDGFV